ncbi:hypothetical protein HS125_08355 [bacterium]|nr:hypothetical protein [bacterium]
MASVKCDETIVPAPSRWVSGKSGIGSPITKLGLLFPVTAPAIAALEKVPYVKDVLHFFKVRLFVLMGGTLKASGRPAATEPAGWEPRPSPAKSPWRRVAHSRRVQALDANVGASFGLTGVAEFQYSPKFALASAKLKGAGSVYAQWKIFTFTRKWDLFEWELYSNPNLKPEAAPVHVEGLEALLAGYGLHDLAAAGDDQIIWEPIRPDFLRFGPGHRLPEVTLIIADDVVDAQRAAPSEGTNREQDRITGAARCATTAGSLEELVVENVYPLARPRLVVASPELDILFGKYDETKPWYAAGDMMAARKTGASWSLAQITDDLSADLEPSVVASGTNTLVAAWSRISGDVSGTTEPEQVYPHLEIVAATFDRTAGTWSAPVALTDDAAADRAPLAVEFGDTVGVVWIQNQAGALLGAATAPDRLMWSKLTGGVWSASQTVWTATTGIVQMAFAADNSGDGHLCLIVDEDGDMLTETDRELYSVSTVGGAWGAMRRLTYDQREDILPVVIAPGGAAVVVWSSSGELRYGRVKGFLPRPVFAREADNTRPPTALAGTSLPGGAAIAYAAQNPDHVDILAAFYDSAQNLWSQPRALTEDDAVESSLSLGALGDELLVSYMKTQTLRSATDVVSDGTVFHLNLVEPGQNDIYLLRHRMGHDMAISSEGIRMSSDNPVPGALVSLSVTVENRGDLAAQNARVDFYDGDPAGDGVFIGTRVLGAPLVAGTTAAVTVPWTVPATLDSHVLVAIVDPFQQFDDRDRGNNTALRATVLPDLAIDTITSGNVGDSTRLVTTRVVNLGSVPSGPFLVTVRVGAPTGEIISNQPVAGLVHGGTLDLPFFWNTHLEAMTGADFALLFAQLDATDSVLESDETNNAAFAAVEVNLANTPTPTPSFTATPTPTPTPTSTYTPSPTPTPTTPVVVTETPTPTATGTPSPTATPSGTATPTPTATLTATPAVPLVPDFNRDGIVNADDLLLMLDGAAPQYDLDGDGVVDLRDWFLFGFWWNRPAQ